MLRSYGPAAVAASSSLFRPLRNVNTTSLHADVPLDEASRRKKYDDLSVGAPPLRTKPRERLYSQEVGPILRQDRRIHSASAALVGATGGAASGSAYSSYTRAQLRQRRLELERELAALESTSVGTSEAGEHLFRSDGPRSGHASTPSTVRERHISAPSLPLPGQHISSSITPPGMEGSTTFENIARDEVLDQSGLPNDWGRNADRRGWKGAPDPTQLYTNQQDRSPPPPPSATRPPSQKRTSWTFWGGGNNSPGRAPEAPSSSASDNGKKNA